MRWKTITLTGWGRTIRASALAARPERRTEMMAALGETTDQILVHGGGRSYGDCALNSGGRVLLTQRLNRILAFNSETGEVTVEPGVTFGELLRIFLPRGWLPPVSPGTGFATVGGAIANDVHGKNHEIAGSFGDHLLWCDLLTPTGDLIRIDPQSQPNLFRATIGGIGLTGIILAACFRLAPTPSNAVWTREHRVRDLDQFLALLSETDAARPYSVGWIDGLARGRNLGRGILERAWPANRGIPPVPRRMVSLPADLPSGLLNRLTVRAFNEIYWRRIPPSGRDGKAPYDKFLFPLDAVLYWNRIYGRRGFDQFQCVVPISEAPLALRRILEAVQHGGNPAFLAVLKGMGGAGRGYLSFPAKGFTLAIDIPRRADSHVLLSRLEHITLEHEGRVYLAKDSALSPEGFAAMFPNLCAFREVLAQVDPQHRMRSNMAVRLGIRESA